MGRQQMLANLVKKGFEVVAFDVVPGALGAAVRLGPGRGWRAKLREIATS